MNHPHRYYPPHEPPVLIDPRIPLDEPNTHATFDDFEEGDKVEVWWRGPTDPVSAGRWYPAVIRYKFG